MCCIGLVGKVGFVGKDLWYMVMLLGFVVLYEGLEFVNGDGCGVQFKWFDVYLLWLFWCVLGQYVIEVVVG